MPFSSLQDAATSTLPDGEGCVAWSRWRWTWSSSGGCMVGRITRRGKSARKPLAGNPHERFEVAGAGNGPVVLGTAPALDPTVCPAKAGVFSGSESHRGKSQTPRSLDSSQEGNRLV